MPVSQLSQIVAALAPRLGPPAGDPVPLEGGITNRNYRARFGGEEYVIRLAGKDTALLGISREAERLAGSGAAELGIAPAVAAFSDDWLVTRFITCRPATAAELAADPAPAATALRAFHDRGRKLPTTFWVPQLAEEYAEIVRSRGGVLAPEYEFAQSIARRIAAVRPLSDPVPCHNDLLTANLIVPASPPPRLMLVDWEYAGMGDPFFDLGNLAVNNDFDEDADRRLLTAYLGREPDPRESAALILMRAMSDVREAAWGIVQGSISELEFDFAAYADAHFARLSATTAEHRFEQALDTAA